MPEETQRSTHHQAHEAIATVWAEIGKPGMRLVRAKYIWLHECCCAHLQQRFGECLTIDEIAEVVEFCLESFLTPLYMRHIRDSDADPGDVLTQMDDVVLDRLRGTWTEVSRREQRYWSNDTELVASTFGEDVDPASYREALNVVRAQGLRTEFLVATQYLDLLDNTGRADFAEVAAKLRFDEETVRKLMFRFVSRLPRRSPGT